ncbi:MAG: GNAT family N-acetyltransferase [Chitinophagaceae bacterium]|nr:GNAT family N-acetyltransferase [Chitinophagaceae bacterium]
MVIRFATTDDAEAIADFSRKTFHETFASVNTPENMNKFMSEQFTKEMLIKEVGEDGNVFLAAYDEGQLMGYVKMRKTINPPELGNVKAIEIARIYAATSSIGKGIGKALMQKTIDVAKEMGKEMLWLGVWEENHRAIEFYKKWGFVKFAWHKFILGDDVQTDWLMKKELK